jgi:cytochrome d ubiquinol oxidase subunit I
MDPILLARLQFAITCVYHFFFVPLTLGLSLLVAIMQTLWVRTGNDVYKRMTKFWGKLFLINFALGVVTGIVMEFQFGMNWSEYSRFVGDIFGAPLAIEALLAFYLESTFLGIWIFGWDRVSKKIHLASIWLVAIGANISALWILIANSFMQQPMGFEFNATAGRAEMVNFFEVMFNPNMFVMAPHVLSAGLATAAFFILGISAYHLYKKTDIDVFRRSFQMAAIVGLVAALLVAFTGHTQGQHMVETQPMKMAAAEALWHTEDYASMSLITIGDLEQRNDVFSIRVPGLLSLLSYNQLDREVQGIYELQAQYEQQYGPGEYIPPVALTYWSFRIMVGAGFAMIALTAYAVYRVMGDTFEISRRWLLIFLAAIALPYLANSFGWIMTEVGRAPWAVYGLLKLEDSVSPNVSAGLVLATLIGYVAVYGILIGVDIFLLRKFAKVVPAKSDQLIEK